MARPPRLIPDDEGAGRLLPWVFAVMTFLAVLALAAALVLRGLVDGWNAGLAGVMTVELAPGATQAEVRAAEQTLAGTAGVASAVALGEADVARLIEPWLGSGAAAAGLPLPVLIDVRIDPGQPLDRDFLARRLAAVAPDARIDDHHVCLARLAPLATGVMSVAAAIVAAVVLATGAIVAFATRAAFAAHRDVVELLHLMGARDAYVARLFQSQALRLGLRGGLMGLGLAGLVLAGLWQLAQAVATPLTERLALAPVDLAVLALSVPLVVAIAVLTARLAVLRSLRQMP